MNIEIMFKFATMTGKEAAEYLGIHPSALSLMIKNGLIRTTRHPDDARCCICNNEDILKIGEARRQKNKLNSMSCRVNPEGIVRSLGYNLEELRSRYRFRQLVDQRRVVASVMYRFGYTIPSIGKFLNRDRATIINLIYSSYLTKNEIEAALQILEKENQSDVKD